MPRCRIGLAISLPVVLLSTLTPTARELPLYASGPPPAHWEAYAMDSHRNALVRFGGTTGARDGQVAYETATWEWTDRGWRATVASDDGPGARHAHGMAYHPDVREVFLAGGMRVDQGKEISLCDTWQYDGRRWRRLQDGPCGAAGATLVFDTQRRHLLWIEGAPMTPTGEPRLRLWRWTPGRWVLVEAQGPRGVDAARAAFDDRRGVLVVLASDGPDAGVWEWNGERWRHAVVPGPPARGAFGLAYDPVSSRIVLAGGRSHATRSPLGDIWTWDGTRWQERRPSPDVAPGPGPRSHATLIRDRDRLLYVGGSAGGPLLDELWILTGDRWQRWSLP